MKRSSTAGNMTKLLMNIQTVLYRLMNLFTFRPAEIVDFYTDQLLLFQGATCRVAWTTRNAYAVKLVLDGKFYKSYKPSAMAELPVSDVFRVEIIARGIYGNARQSLAVKVNDVQFKEAVQFGLAAAAETRPKVHKSLSVRPNAMLPVTPAPILMPLPVTLDNPFLVASRESLEQDIITNSYQSENN